ncbi:MAG: stage II sporulation protein M [Myxococcota bacterium]
MNDTAITPRSVRFRQAREREWKELEKIVTIALNRGLKALDEEQLQQLPRLYRDVLSSVSVARSTAMDRNMVDYLESLASRAYLAMYGARKLRRHALFHFAMVDFPRRVRAMRLEAAIALVLFLVGCAVSFLLVRSDVGWFYSFIPADLAAGRDPAAATHTLRESLYGTGDGWLGTFSSFLFTHNARIGMLAFALGFAAGVPTALLLFVNGLNLGAFFALFADRGLAIPLLGWLLPHGIPEIAAVILCGMAGLHIGRAVLVPGPRPIRDALRDSGKEAAVVVGGAIVLFAYAALIEGVFRQTVHSEVLRFSMAVFNAVWLVTWLTLSGRFSQRRDR